MRHARDIDAGLVAVDVSACCRTVVAQIKAERKSPTMTARDIASVLYRKMTRWHPDATEFAWVFDSYDDMHPMRYRMYTEGRYRKATPERLANLRAGEVAVNERVYKYAQRPYAPGDIREWTPKTPVDGDRLFSSAAAKRLVYGFIARELVCLSAEHPGERTAYIDTIKSHDAPNAVITVRTKDDTATITPSARCVKHGEADQKIASFFAHCPDKGAAGGVWRTCDYDSVGQCVCCGLKCKIAFPNNQVVDPAKLPQGPACAMALLCNGGDYNDSMKYAQISSTGLFDALAAGAVPPLLGVSDTGLRLDIEGLFTFLTSHQTARRKRSVFVIPGEPAHKFYRMRSAAEQAARGGEVRKRVPSGSMISYSVAELVRATAYWMLGASANSTDRAHDATLEVLYRAIEKSFPEPSKPTNVLDLRAAVVCKEEIVAEFSI